MIERFLKRHWAALQWARAVRLSSREKFERTLRIARGIEEAERKRSHWRLFEMHQYGLLKDHANTLSIAETLIGHWNAKESLTETEKYCLAFAQWYGLVAFGRLYPSRPFPECLKFDLESFRLADVRPYWKKTFPMPIHPEWDDSDVS
ncbi:MAG: hypothetical protein ACLFWF_13845 [Alphaproteobacteria bacterium]